VKASHDAQLECLCASVSGVSRQQAATLCKRRNLYVRHQGEQPVLVGSGPICERPATVEFTKQELAKHDRSVAAAAAQNGAKKMQEQYVNVLTKQAAMTLYVCGRMLTSVRRAFV